MSSSSAIDTTTTTPPSTANKLLLWRQARADVKTSGKLKYGSSDYLKVQTCYIGKIREQYGDAEATKVTNTLKTRHVRQKDKAALAVRVTDRIFERASMNALRSLAASYGEEDVDEDDDVDGVDVKHVEGDEEDEGDEGDTVDDGKDEEHVIRTSCGGSGICTEIISRLKELLPGMAPGTSIVFQNVVASHKRKRED